MCRLYHVQCTMSCVVLLGFQSLPSWLSKILSKIYIIIFVYTQNSVNILSNQHTSKWYYVMPSLHSSSFDFFLSQVALNFVLLHTHTYAGSSLVYMQARLTHTDMVIIAEITPQSSRYIQECVCTPDHEIVCLHVEYIMSCECTRVMHIVCLYSWQMCSFIYCSKPCKCSHWVLHLTQLWSGNVHNVNTH